MTKFKVQLNEAFCKKKNCNRPRRHRHHRGHEFLFVVRWENLPVDQNDCRKEEWCVRYWQFHEDDTVDLCAQHHAEVHLAYDRIIMQDNRVRGYRLDLYTYDDAVRLRDKLRIWCDKWLKRETPGVDPSKVFGRIRTKNQARAKEKKDATKKKSDRDN